MAKGRKRKGKTTGQAGNSALPDSASGTPQQPSSTSRKQQPPAAQPAQRPRPDETFQPLPEFDRLEDQIRGEQVLAEEQGRRDREEREIRKKLAEKEIDRRLEELRKKIGK